MTKPGQKSIINSYPDGVYRVTEHKEETSWVNVVHTAVNATGKKVRDEKEYKDLIHRLSRIEGQVRGIREMVESDRYCVDILTQVSAIQSALNSFNKVLLSSHIKSCVVEDIRQGKEGAVDELCKTIQKLMK